MVVSNAGKKRLVINLRHLNRFLWKQKFKYEDLHVAMLLFERGDYMFSFDLKSGYHHVDIHWKYLGFSWGGKCYVFTTVAQRDNGPGSRIPHPGPRTPGFAFQIPHPGSRTPDPGPRM